MKITVQPKAKQNNQSQNKGQQKKKNKNKNKKKGGKKGRNSFLSNDTKLGRYFLAGTVAPDIMGPIRIPRFGASQRTGLGMDRTTFYLGSTTVYNAFSPVTTFNQANVSGTYQSAANATTLFSTPANVNIGQQFPTIASIADVNITGISILLSYVGAPLNCTGEIVMGQFPSSAGLDTSSFSSLSYYPGTVRVPLSTLLNEPLRVYGQKMSPSANDFIAVDAECDDYSLPFFAITPLATANSLCVQVTRTFEYRAQLATTAQVPYVSATGSHSKDLSVFEDAMAELAQAAVPVTEGITEYVREFALGSLGAMTTKYLPGAVTAAASLIPLIGNRAMARHNGGLLGV